MAKKTKPAGIEQARLLKRLHEAHDQLRAHSSRTSEAADTLRRLLQQVEEHITHANGATSASSSPGRTAPVARPAGAGTGPIRRRTPRPARSRDSNSA